MESSVVIAMNSHHLYRSNMSPSNITNSRMNPSKVVHRLKIRLVLSKILYFLWMLISMKIELWTTKIPKEVCTQRIEKKRGLSVKRSAL